MSTAKKKALIISCIAVVLCAAVIAGATYALFTDGEQYAIGVNTGKIDVSAALSMEDAWSESQAGVKENATKGEGEITSLTVPQGGKVSIAEGKTVTFSDMSLGDGARFSLSFNNKSTVDMQYRVSVSVNAGASKLLRDHLTLKVNDGAAADMFADGQEQTALIDWTAVETGENNAPAALDKLTFEIALPWSALADSETYDEAQSISLTVKMEAIQANADSMPVYVTLEEASAGALEEALSAVEEGGTGFITLPEGEISWTDAMSELTANKTLTIAGAGQGKTVISAAAGSGFTQIKLQGTVTIKDLSTTGKRYSLFVNNPSGTQSAEPFIVDNCDMSDISVSKGAAVEIRNMNIDDAFYVTASAGSQVTLKDSTIKNSSKSNTLISRTENFVAENCTIIAEQAYCVSAVDGGKIELNGCALTAQAEGKTAIAANGENSRVVIEDCDVTAFSSPLFAYNGGKITLESGNVSSSKKSDSILVQMGYSGQGSGTFEMNGGVLDASTPGSSAVFMEEDSLVTITGGSVKADTFALSTNNTTGGDVVVNISGGEIIAANATAIYMPIGKELNISGGSVCGTAAIDARIGAVNLSGNAVLTATKAQAEPLRFVSYNEPQGVNGGSSADGAVIILNGNIYTANGTVKALSLTIEEGVTLNSASGEYVHVYDWNRLEEKQSVSVNAGSYAVKNYFYDGNEEGTVTEKA